MILSSYSMSQMRTIIAAIGDDCIIHPDGVQIARDLNDTDWRKPICIQDGKVKRVPELPDDYVNI